MGGCPPSEEKGLDVNSSNGESPVSCPLVEEPSVVLEPLVEAAYSHLEVCPKLQKTNFLSFS